MEYLYSVEQLWVKNSLMMDELEEEVFFIRKARQALSCWFLFISITSQRALKPAWFQLKRSLGLVLQKLKTNIMLSQLFCRVRRFK